MRHVRMLGVCLAAALGIAAVAATSASALPEWGECVVQAKHEGRYTNSNCTKKATKVEEKFTGEFEFIKGKELPNRKFTGHSVGTGGILDTGANQCEGGKDNKKRVPRATCTAEGGEVLEFHGTSFGIECTGEEDSGETHSTKNLVNAHVLFTGCLFLGSFPCTSALKANEGEIETNALKGELGYISKSKHEVGVRLTPVKAHGLFAQFVCNAGPENHIIFKVGVGNETEGSAYLPEKTGGNDGIISPITPVNAMASEFTQVYTVNPETTENVPSKFEGKPIALLEDAPENTVAQYMWSRAGEEVTSVQTPQSPEEIKG